jgi:hypothetical protein
VLKQRAPSELWGWLGTLPDANGRVHGVAAGSLGTRAEERKTAFKVTAAQFKQSQRAGGAAVL